MFLPRFPKIVQIQSSFAYFGTLVSFHEESEWNDIASKFHPILTELNLVWFLSKLRVNFSVFHIIFISQYKFDWWNKLQFTNSPNNSMTDLLRIHCFKYGHCANKEIELYFIIFSNFGCCRKHSKWSHDNKLWNKSFTTIHTLVKLIILVS